MATIKEATENAAAFARETLGPARTQGLRLEEIVTESENGHDVWHITLSMVAEDADSEGCRSAFRTDVDHDSEVMPISVPN
jgi:hypothetical protein